MTLPGISKLCCPLWIRLTPRQLALIQTDRKLGLPISNLEFLPFIRDAGSANDPNYSVSHDTFYKGEDAISGQPNGQR